MRSLRLFICFAGFLFLVSACATAPQKTEIREKKLSAEDQDKKAVEVFDRILKLTEKTEDRQSLLPQMEDLYEEIINKYPDSSIIRESYLRLITMEITEFSPPRIEKAEGLYGDFYARYPGSEDELKLERVFGRFYYENKLWDRLLRIFTPQVKKFIQTGKLDSPYCLFMYSEAKFNLNDLVEAEKGYKIVDAFFPDTDEGVASRNRLEEIKKIKEQAPKGYSTGQ